MDRDQRIPTSFEDAPLKVSTSFEDGPPKMSTSFEDASPKVPAANKGFDSFYAGSIVGAMSTVGPLTLVHQDMNVGRMMRNYLFARSFGVGLVVLQTSVSYQRVKRANRGRKE